MAQRKEEEALLKKQEQLAVNTEMNRIKQAKQEHQLAHQKLGKEREMFILRQKEEKEKKLSAMKEKRQNDTMQRKLVLEKKKQEQENLRQRLLISLPPDTNIESQLIKKRFAQMMREQERQKIAMVKKEQLLQKLEQKKLNDEKYAQITELARIEREKKQQVLLAQAQAEKQMKEKERKLFALKQQEKARLAKLKYDQEQARLLAKKQEMIQSHKVMLAQYKEKLAPKESVVMVANQKVTNPRMRAHMERTLAAKEGKKSVKIAHGPKMPAASVDKRVVPAGIELP